MRKIKNKKAAMEMSVGTIVTVVLLMTVLILGLMLVRTIFSSAKGAIDLTDAQLRNEIAKSFGSQDRKIMIFPETRILEIKQDSSDGIGIGIRNLMQGVQGNIKFSYRVEVEEHTCGNVNTLNWIELGRTSSGISIPVGDFAVRRINFRVPVGSPLCTVRYSLEVQANNEIYANDYFDVRVKAR